MYIFYKLPFTPQLVDPVFPAAFKVDAHLFELGDALLLEVVGGLESGELGGCGGELGFEFAARALRGGQVGAELGEGRGLCGCSCYW